MATRRPPPKAPPPRDPHDPDSGESTRLDDDELDQADEPATAHHPDSGVVGELRAKLSTGKLASLPHYALSDRRVVGRGQGCDWQIDETSRLRPTAELKKGRREPTAEDVGMLGAVEGTCKSQLHRARELGRARLESGARS